MIKDIEEESKTKFSMKAEFSFSFKEEKTETVKSLQKTVYLIKLYSRE